jgi:hypothetical protein
MAGVELDDAARPGGELALQSGGRGLPLYVDEIEAPG